MALVYLFHTNFPFSSAKRLRLVTLKEAGQCLLPAEALQPGHPGCPSLPGVLSFGIFGGVIRDVDLGESATMTIKLKPLASPVLQLRASCQSKGWLQANDGNFQRNFYFLLQCSPLNALMKLPITASSSLLLALEKFQNSL